MQGAVDILVAVTYTYISEESPAQNAHAENSETFINARNTEFPPHFKQDKNKTTQTDTTVSHNGVDEDFFRDRMQHHLVHGHQGFGGARPHR
jgi:hypothetical protein